MNDNILELQNDNSEDALNKDDMSIIDDCITAMAMNDNSAPDVEEELEALMTKVQRQRHMSISKKTILYTVLAAAASLLLLCMMVWPHDEKIYTAVNESQTEIIVRQAYEKETPNTKNGQVSESRNVNFRTIVVPERKDASFTLPDGTQVWLNAGSRLTYPEKFSGATRMVSLSGEAYFHVVSDKAHPFIVNAGNLTARVTGTQFNIRSYEGLQEHITLVDGAVTVSSQTQEIDMKPGEHVVLEAASLQKQDADIDAFIAWREGMLYFQDATLRDILLEMGRWYNYNVVYRDDIQDTTHYHFACDRRGNVQDAVQMLRKVTGQDIYVKGNTIFIQK